MDSDQTAPLVFKECLYETKDQNLLISKCYICKMSQISLKKTMQDPKLKQDFNC